VIDTDVFSISSISNWYGYIRNQITENPNKLLTTSVWRQSVNLIGTNNRGSLRSNTKYYLDPHKVAKTQDKQYRQQLENLLSSFEEGTQLKILGVKAQYHSLQREVVEN
jgi:hypothetical protein